LAVAVLMGFEIFLFSKVEVVGVEEDLFGERDPLLHKLAFLDILLAAKLDKEVGPIL
jgi:hypothetical protein